MDRTYHERLRNLQSPLLRELTTLQHLWPHLPIQQALRQLCEQRGITHLIASRALTALALPGSRAVGRLSRAQLTTLASAIDTGAQTPIGEQVHAA